MVVLAFAQKRAMGVAGAPQRSRKALKENSRKREDGVAVSIVLGQVAARIHDRLDIFLHAADGVFHEALGQGHGARRRGCAPCARLVRSIVEDMRPTRRKQGFAVKCDE